MPAMFNRWRTAIRDAEKTRITHIILSDDSVAFSPTQTTANPTGGSTVTLIKTSSESDVDAFTFDATITVNGNTELTNKNIFTIAPADGGAATNALGRIVRTQPIGVQAGDTFTIGVRFSVVDNTP